MQRICREYAESILEACRSHFSFCWAFWTRSFSSAVISAGILAVSYRTVNTTNTYTPHTPHTRPHNNIHGLVPEVFSQCVPHLSQLERWLRHSHCCVTKREREREREEEEEEDGERWIGEKEIAGKIEREVRRTERGR